jgi:undecaprenyl-diphosphatase
MNLIEAIILAIVEGLTEFLPVSSTGHMILAENIMQIQDDKFVKSFTIAIQLGAIISVIVVYYKRFLIGLDIYFKLAIAFFPTGIIGFLAYKTIKTYLFNSLVVSVALIAGGIILIIFDKWSEKRKSQFDSLEDVSYKKSFFIGLIQCFSMIPGMSRAAATIFGGLYAGFDRKQAAEFSFLLAIPTMFAATGYDLLKEGSDFTSDQYFLLLVGSIVAFVFALLAIKTFIAFVTRYGFTLFGYYRIAIGVVFLLLSWYMGIELKS